MEQKLLHIETENAIPEGEGKEPNEEGMEYGELYEVVQEGNSVLKMFITRR